MPIPAARDDTRQLVVARATGPLLIADLLTFLSEHRTGGARRYSLLLDLRDVTTMPSTADLQVFADLLGELSRGAPRGRAALVAATDRVHEAAQVLEQLCDAAGVHTVRAWRSLDEAEAWLAEAV